MYLPPIAGLCALMKMKMLIAAMFSLSSLSIRAGEISDLHRQQVTQRMAREHAEKRVRRRVAIARIKREKTLPEQNGPTSQAVEEVGIERNFGFGNPIYTFIVKSDGSFRYEGKDGVERKGRFSGTVPRASFDAVAKLIREADYMGLQDSYKSEAMDVTPVYTTVVLGGRRHVVENSGTGPAKLRTIQRLIDALLAQAIWDAPLPQDESSRTRGIQP